MPISSNQRIMDETDGTLADFQSYQKGTLIFILLNHSEKKSFYLRLEMFTW